MLDKSDDNNWVEDHISKSVQRIPNNPTLGDAGCEEDNIPPNAGDTSLMLLPEIEIPDLGSPLIPMAGDMTI